MFNLFSAGIFIHIIGITLIAGGSVGGLILENHLWKLIRQAPEKASALEPLMTKYPIIIQVGTVLMLISGFMLLAALEWAPVHQAWFIVKMALVVALVLNGSLVAEPTGKKIGQLVPMLLQGKPLQKELHIVKRRMTIFHISEMAMLLLVYVLAVFRF